MASYNQNTVKVSQYKRDTEGFEIRSVQIRIGSTRNQIGASEIGRKCSKQDGGVQNWAEGSRFRGKFQNSFIDLCQIGGNVQNRANLSNSTVITYRPW